VKGQDLIDKLARQMQPPAPTAVQTNGHASEGGTAALPIKGSAASATDEEVITKCRGAKNAPKFEALYDRGDVRAHHGGDDSAADLSLLGMLTFWTQDEVQLERLFSASALGRREKWRKRPDYRQRTITKALSELGEATTGTATKAGVCCHHRLTGTATKAGVCCHHRLIPLGI
jgi:primase-polymerase (primpol)-like protein